MAKPRSEEKRSAILAAATRVFATQGLGAPTAAIAQAAGVSNGSLFTYFETKTELFNQLYLELKAEQGATAREALAGSADLREQARHVWGCWMAWATSYPERRRTLAQLDVSDEITPESRAAGHAIMKDAGELLHRMRADGPLRDVPLGFAIAIMSALSDTTADSMIREPDTAQEHCEVGFEALWRVLK